MSISSLRRVIAPCLISALLLLTGCAPRAVDGNLVDQVEDGDIVVDLPAVLIEYDTSGQPGIGGIPLSALNAVIPAQVTDLLTLQPNNVRQLMDNNVERVQLNSRPDGLRITMNGQEIPSVGWDRERLRNAATLAAAVNPDLADLSETASTLAGIGVAATLQFPRAEGSAPIPAAPVPEAGTSAGAAVQETFIAGVGQPPTINIPVFYDEAGGWMVAGLNQTEWQALTGLPWESLKLPPHLIAGAKDSGIDTVALAANADGLFVTIDEMALPYLNWGDGKLRNTIDLAIAAGLIDTETLPVSPQMLAEILEQMLPIVLTTNLTISVFFP